MHPLPFPARPATVSIPADSLEAARLVVERGAARMTIGAGSAGDLVTVSGPAPELVSTGAVVTLRQTQRWRGIRAATAVGVRRRVPWTIDVAGGAARLGADLRDLHLRAFSIAGGASDVDLWLPVPAGPVTIAITGGAARVTIRRPTGVPFAVEIEHGATHLTLDDMALGAVGGALRWASRDDDDGRCYRLVVAGAATGVTIASWMPAPTAPYRDAWRGEAAP